MEDALMMGRLQFGFTVMFHYLFPQLTMGLALLIVVMKGLALRTGDTAWDGAARFWARVFAINFAMGVVTGIPLEFQFGTNWARFSHYAGGVIGQTLAMEGLYAFFLESSFLGLFLYGERRLGPRLHFATACLIFAGSWASGYLIVATNAWMQHPVGYAVGQDGALQLTSFTALLLNPWAFSQYAHTMVGSVLTGGFVVSAVGAFYVLRGDLDPWGRRFLRVGVPTAFLASILALAPTGDFEGGNVARHQPVKLAAMEGLFQTKEGAELVLIGQPDMEKLAIDNPVVIPRMLSFLTYNRWNAEVRGLDAFPRDTWPDNIPLTYYAYHIMVGLGTVFIALTTLSALQLRRRRLFTCRPLLWALMLAAPFPYIANTAGWMTAELGRQPWLVYGLMRTAEGTSATVSAGNILFTLLGFFGMYALLALLFLFLVGRLIVGGPGDRGSSDSKQHHPAD